MASYRSSASFGKRQEYIATAELLRRGHDVYMTLVDDQQIDCIVRVPETPPRYIDVQIKARSSKAKQASTFAGMEIREPRPNFYFMFFVEACDSYWIFPSEDLVQLANTNKSGENAGKKRIVLANKRRDGRWTPRPKWEAYRNNFDIFEARNTDDQPPVI